MTRLTTAPAWETSAWLNSPGPLPLSDLRGKVVVLHAFQMLCPGCVLHGLPQAQRIHESFADDRVAVIGLHSVFEHHASMQLEALKAFVGEFRFSFPIAVDRPNGLGLPCTMAAYQLQGTPSLLLIDPQGNLRHHYFGRPDDLVVGAAIGQLLSQPTTQPQTKTGQTCSPQGSS